MLPKSEIEYLVNIIVIFISCGMFGYMLNCIGTILGNMEKESNKVRETIQAINYYMHKKNITFELQY